MLDVLRSLRSLLKISRIHTDGNIFRLHYSVTVIILMTCCIIITTKQNVGEPIDCLRNDAVEKSIMNSFCWTNTTYSIRKAFNKTVGVDVPYPGVDNSNDASEFQHHKYYQWVCYVLFLQAAAFYMPRYLWKLWESGKVEAVVMHLDVGIGFEPDLTLKKQAIVDYLYSSSGHHDWYAARYFFCECLAFANIIAQMYLLDSFFDGQFMHYGINVIKFIHNIDQESRIDPMQRIFPRVTKCKFHKYGHSATLETIDALCLLPLNVINEKIYILLWFWFVFLAGLTFLMLILGVIIIISPGTRVYMLNLRFRTQTNQLKIIVRKSTVGDWFLLYLVGKNMDSYILKDIVAELAQRYLTKGMTV